MTPEQREVVTDAIAIGAVTGAYAISFGAVAVAAGLSIAQACVLSLLMFTGGSQFAMVGTIAGGGGAWAGAGTAALLGVRHSFYGLELTPILRVKGLRRLGSAHLIIDESAAMSVAQPTPQLARLGFWVTGAAVFVVWNAMTLVGAAGASALEDPGVLGLDAAGPAAFVALLSHRLTGREPWVVALVAAGVALASVPLVPAGVPVLLAAAVAVVTGLRPGAPPDDPAVDGPEPEDDA